MPEIPEYVQQEARKELARRYFYDYCQLKYPTHYTDDKAFLKIVCDEMQLFMEQSQYKFLVINLPPRHYKSFSGSAFVEWCFGRNPNSKVMTGSYNERLSTTFARKVRDTIMERPSKGSKIITYSDIFPETRIKDGQASASLWALDGSGQDNYLATSPKGTATGFGADIVVIDDIIKNAIEALNERVLEEHWDWFNNTIMQRTEGGDYKFIIIMTRWAEGDLAGRIIKNFGDKVKHVIFPAVQEDGSMLCDSILSKEDYKIKTQEMRLEIAEANYNQKPMDIEGRLYKQFEEWKELPESIIKRNNTDVADQGKDYLSSWDWFEREGKVYVTDIFHSNAKAEETEPMVAKMLHADGINEAEFESNNGGKGYARNIERELKALANRKCVVKWTPQTQNKEARILTSSAWVQKNILMPPNWTSKYPQAAEQILTYVAGGKNQPDDAPDVLATIYERVANVSPIVYASSR